MDDLQWCFLYSNNFKILAEVPFGTKKQITSRVLFLLVLYDRRGRWGQWWDNSFWRSNTLLQTILLVLLLLLFDLFE